MTARLIRTGRTVVATGALVAVIALPTGLAVAQVVRTSVDLSAGAGYSTNPFLVADDDAASALVEASVRPQVVIEEERSRTTLEAFINHQQYFENYGGVTNYGGSFAHDTRLSERLSVNAGASIFSGIIGGAQFAPPVFAPPVPPVDGGTTPVPGVPAVPPVTGAPTVPGLPGVPPIGTPIGGPIVPGPVFNDIGLLGTQARQTSYSGSLGLTYSPSTRSTWGAGISAQRSTFDGEFPGGDFSSFTGNVSYTRALNEGLSVGGQIVASRTSFDQAPNATVIQPTATLNVALSPQWSLNAGLGVAITEFGGGFGLPASNSTTLAGNLGLCRRAPRSNLCVTAARSAAPSGFGGVQNFTTAGVSYSYQLGERDGLTASAAYSRNDGSQFDIGDQEFITASVGWARQLNQRLRMNATVGYRNVGFGGREFNAGDDFTGLLSIGYILGDRR